MHFFNSGHGPVTAGNYFKNVNWCRKRTGSDQKCVPWILQIITPKNFCAEIRKDDFTGSLKIPAIKQSLVIKWIRESSKGKITIVLIYFCNGSLQIHIINVYNLSETSDVLKGKNHFRISCKS